MGSDKAPESEIRGAILASRTLGVRVHLVGPQEILRPALDRALRGRFPVRYGRKRPQIEIVHSSEWISMEDKAAQAVRAKRDSSMRVGLRMVREGTAAGFFTAGNTGAAMATAKMVLGMLAGVHRPGLSTILPTALGIPSILLDVGANVDCDPDNLVQFAVMGHMYARNVLHIAHPRVGLLSIGEEDSKGNSLTHDTFPLLQARPEMNFIGNVEGRDLFNGHAAVIVCDGFVGNVANKTWRAPHAWSASCCASPSSPPSPRSSGPCSPAAPSTTSRSASTTPSSAARRCWASAASASSATAHPTSAPS